MSALLCGPDAAAYLAVARSTLYQWAAEGRIPSVRISDPRRPG